MSQYVNSVTQRLNTGALMTLSRSREKWTGLSDLSHYLMGSDTVDDLAESATKYIVDILAVDYCRIILQDGDGQFYCKASYTQKYPFKMHGSVKESFAASAVYARLLGDDATAKLYLAHEHLSR